MQIIKWNHKEEKGIYKVSEAVKSFNSIKAVAFDMVEWLNKNNGKFPDPYKMAYAVSHCQVEADPWAFFVVNEELLGNKWSKQGRNVFKNYYFPSQIIVNPVILDTPEKIKTKKPKREIKQEAGKVMSRVVLEDTVEKNIIGVPEACMSFPLRTQKTMERYYRIKVRYQYPKKLFGVWYLATKTEWVEGLKSHIFQHEVDHMKAKNMYYDNSR